MCWAPLYSSYLQECDKGCEVNLKAEGEPEKGVACLQHIFPQFVVNTYSLPSKVCVCVCGGGGGGEGGYLLYGS